jgi:hypothetical protein
MMRGDIVDHRANPPDREAATAWGRGRPVHKMIQEPAFKAGFFSKALPVPLPLQGNGEVPYSALYRNILKSLVGKEGLEPDLQSAGLPSAT